MSFRPDHELHKRRLGRNLGLGGALLAFVLLVFGMTIEKVHNGAPATAFVGEPVESQPSTGSGDAP
jgi:hypothetical protein